MHQQPYCLLPLRTRLTSPRPRPDEGFGMPSSFNLYDTLKSLATTVRLESFAKGFNELSKTFWNDHVLRTPQGTNGLDYESDEEDDERNEDVIDKAAN
ncbi:hypothetical protein EVAR_40839_1 [Eumeta japonica]|uniref:Uncharacterized protein n=1 Tax=Eumeta variegata TaxID=151549 RepID=A0A4C1WJG5_EUMVA|nr:hypothetical protein EVAR_40839_1 [Eumeta japonica]